VAWGALDDPFLNFIVRINDVFPHATDCCGQKLRTIRAAGPFGTRLTRTERVNDIRGDATRAAALRIDVELAIVCGVDELVAERTRAQDELTSHFLPHLALCSLQAN